jgi:hypothetical protein
MQYLWTEYGYLGDNSETPSSVIMYAKKRFIKKPTILQCNNNNCFKWRSWSEPPCNYDFKYPDNWTCEASRGLK